MPVVSWELESFEQGGLLNDVDVEFTNCRFEMFDYKGKADPIVAFAVDLKLDGGDVNEQFWSCGGKDTDMKPSDDGQTIESDAGVTLKKGSAFHALVTELVKFGVDSKLFAKAGNLTGLRAHMVRRKLGNNTKADGSDNMVLVPTEILKGKGKATAAAGKPAAAATTKPAAVAAEPSGDVATEAVTALKGIAKKMDDGATMDIKRLKVEATKALLKHAQRQDVITTMLIPAWLEENGEAAGVLFDGEAITKL